MFPRAPSEKALKILGTSQQELADAERTDAERKARVEAWIKGTLPTQLGENKSSSPASPTLPPRAHTPTPHPAGAPTDRKEEEIYPENPPQKRCCGLF